jgi:hypothetical protein
VSRLLRERRGRNHRERDTDSETPHATSSARSKFQVRLALHDALQREHDLRDVPTWCRARPAQADDIGRPERNDARLLQGPVDARILDANAVPSALRISHWRRESKLKPASSLFTRSISNRVCR